MVDPDHDTTGVIETLLSDAANYSNGKPDVVRVRRDEKSVPPGTNEYILIADTSEHFENWRGARTTLDHGSAVFAEAKVIDSHARRVELKDDVVQVLRDVRDDTEASANGLSIGSWDTVDYEYTFPDEEIFDVFPIQFTFTFRAYSRTA
jgi:hypothetical protein